MGEREESGVFSFLAFTILCKQVSQQWVSEPHTGPFDFLYWLVLAFNRVKISTQKYYFLAIPVTTCSVEGEKFQCNFALIQKHTFVFSQKARQVTAVLLNGFTCAKISQRLAFLPL